MTMTDQLNGSAFTKFRSSCRSCHKSHKKCDGKNSDAPCSRCQKRNESCVWDEQRKRGPKRKRQNDDDSLNDEGSESGGHEEKRRKSSDLHDDLAEEHNISTSSEVDSLPTMQDDIEKKEFHDTNQQNKLQFDDHTIKVNILLAGSGSVACIKIPEIVHTLSTLIQSVKDDRGQVWNVRFSVSVILTEAAKRFVSKQKINDYSSGTPKNYPPVQVLEDEDEWRKWSQIGDDVVHIDLRKKFDMMVIAPLSANTLAKISNGLCDNLLTCVVRAWNFQDKPMLACPAMNTLMWENYFTSKQIDVLQRELGIYIGFPVAKRLACGDVGIGAMLPPEEIVHKISQLSLQFIVPKKLMQINGSVVTTECNSCQKPHPIIPMHEIQHGAPIHNSGHGIGNSSLNSMPMNSTQTVNPTSNFSISSITHSNMSTPSSSHSPSVSSIISSTVPPPHSQSSISPHHISQHQNAYIPPIVSNPYNMNQNGYEYPHNVPHSAYPIPSMHNNFNTSNNYYTHRSSSAPIPPSNSFSISHNQSPK